MMNQREARHNLSILLRTIDMADKIIERNEKRNGRLLKDCSFREIWNNFSKSNQRI